MYVKILLVKFGTVLKAQKNTVDGFLLLLTINFRIRRLRT